MRSGMNIRKFATITFLVLSSFAANNVAPTKVELESMYNAAFKEFSANNYTQALKELDALDARQPDLAESHNLRGVILMRQGLYDQAEAALQKALATDPKFLNARFNLAEIPFLRKEWAEARKRFEGLLGGNPGELQGEAIQLIQYKILLTYLLEGRENMVDSMMAKFELSPDTPAVHYANAAIAFQHKNEQEAKDWLGKAEKKFSPALNRLFAESLYEVGWMQKPAGQSRAALELTSAADRQAKAKALAGEKFEQAEQAFQQRDLTAARRLVEEADAADPNQAATINLRGEILLAQKDFDGAEAAFKQAAKVDPKFREAQYNLAQIPFKKKEYTKARERFEALFNSTPAPGGDKNQAAQAIKFKIFLTLLLEGKDSRAQKMMEQFQFTGDTPALYYAQAAWEFKHNNPSKANDWIVSARKIYSPALNLLFADSFYDLGWLQGAAAPPVVASSESAKSDSAPSIEPSPIPDSVVAASKAKPGEAAAQKQPGTAPATTTASAAQSPATSPVLVAKNEQAAVAPASSPSVETPVASSALPSETRAPLPQEREKAVSAPSTSSEALAQQNPATGPATSSAAAQQSPATAPADKVAPAVVSTPATVLAPAAAGELQKPAGDEGIGNSWLFGVMLLAGILILAWVVVSEIRRRFNVPVYPTPTPATGPRFDATPRETAVEKLAVPTRLVGGPPQVSLQLKASEPSVRRAAVPFGKTSRPFGGGATIATAGVGAVVENFVPREAARIPEPEPELFSAPAPEPISQVEEAIPAAATFDEDADLTPAPVSEMAAFAPAPEAEYVAEATEPATSFEETAVASEEEPTVAEASPAWSTPAEESTAAEPSPAWYAPATAEVVEESVAFEAPVAVEAAAETVVFDSPASFESVSEPIEAPVAFETPAPVEAAGETVVFDSPASFESVSEPIEIPSEIVPEPVAPGPVKRWWKRRTLAREIFEPETEPVAQGQPIPYQVPAFSSEPPMAEITKPEPESRPAPASPIAGVGALRQSVESPSFAPQVISTEPLAQQPNTPATMPLPNQPTSAPAPAIRPTPMTGGAPQSQPASGMQTAVQLTFSFEIASLQLTPSFKMGALQLKPTSKIVTMRLAPSQQPQPAMNLQVTFEVSTVQPAGGGLGMIRLTPSQQQRPSVISSPSFNIAGLQLLSGADSGAVQLTPSQQGQASVHVTGRFQIATVEFSPSFEIASIVLNATSKSVSVQLPGAGPSAVEGAPVFEIANVQIGANGEIGMMQLNAAGTAPKAA